MGSLSKAKGSNFERKMCQVLSLWITGMRRDDTLWRSSMSGGRATLRSKRGGMLAYAQVGDIVPVHADGSLLCDLFCVELKFKKQLYVEALVFGIAEGGVIGSAWLKNAEAAALHRRRSLLIVKQNRRPALAIVDRLGLEVLRIGAGPKWEPHLVVPGRGLYICRLDAMLGDVDFAKIRRAVDDGRLQVRPRYRVRGVGCQ